MAGNATSLFRAWMARPLAIVASLGITWAVGLMAASPALAATTWATGTDSTLWTNAAFYSPNLGNSYNDEIVVNNTVAGMEANGDLMAGFNYLNEGYDMYPGYLLAQWNGSSWSSLPSPGGLTVNGILVGPDGKTWVLVPMSYIEGAGKYYDTGWTIYSYSNGSYSQVASYSVGYNTITSLSMAPGPNDTVLVTAMGIGQCKGSTWNSIWQVNSSYGVSEILGAPGCGTATQMGQAIEGDNGDIWYDNGYGAIYNTSGTELVAGGGQATLSQQVFWGPDARLWSTANGYEWVSGSSMTAATPTFPVPYNQSGNESSGWMTSGSGALTIGPGGSVVYIAPGTVFTYGEEEVGGYWYWGDWSNIHATIYTLQSAPTPSLSPVSMSLPTSWSTWGQVQASTSFNASGLAAQNIDANQQDWGGVSFNLQDENIDGGVFNTTVVPGGAIGAVVNLPTKFGHLYGISANGGFLDPADRNVVIGSATSSAVNYYLPSTTPGVSQVSSVTATTVTVDTPVVWRSSSENYTAYVEPWSDVQSNTWAPTTSCTGITYPSHGCHLTGLTPNTQYGVSVDPNEPSGGAAFGVGWWKFTTDTTPSGSITINDGARITSSATVTVAVSTQNATTPPVAVRFSNDNANWSSWLALTDTPLSGSPVTGSLGASGSYFESNTSLSANQAATDYGHLNNLLYSETDSQVNFPYGIWPTTSSLNGATACSGGGATPQGVLNISSPTPTGNDWSAIWQGYVYAPVSGSYSFAVPSDDGATLVVDGQQIVTEWQPQGTPAASAESGTVTLTGGEWYPFYIQYEQVCGGAGIQFEWQQPPTTTVPNPQYSVVPANDLWSLDPSAVNPTTVTATGSFNWTLPTVVSGTETVYAQVLDINGTVSSTVTASVLEINNSNAPVVSMVLNNGQQSTTSTTVPVTLSVQGSGFTTGIGTIQFQVDGGAWSTWTAYTPTTTVTIPNTPGAHTITVQVKDQNGLTSQATGKITFLSSQSSVQTGGSGSVLAVTGGATTTVGGQSVQVVQGGEVTLTFAPPSVSGSAPTQMMASHDGTTWSPWLPYSSSMSATLTTDELNSVAVRFKYPDGSDSQVYTLSVLPIVTAPTLSASWQGNATATTTSSMTAVISVSDSVLSVTDLSYSVNGGSTWTAVPSASFTASIPISAGVNTVTVEVEDPAGNAADAVLTGWGL